MKLSLIVALGKNNEIGKENQLLCRLSSDLKRFKALTTGHAIVMGRKTYHSLPSGALPNRTNIVLSHDKNLHLESCTVFTSLDAALVHLRNETEIFIIGGGTLYQQALPIADKLYLTKIHTTFPEADTFFPSIDYNDWKLIATETTPANEKNDYDSTFYEYEHV
jgi:dihydrofolate reductase